MLAAEAAEGSEVMEGSDGNECDLAVLCVREPGWAANRIKALRRLLHSAESELADTRSRLAAATGGRDLLAKVRASPWLESLIDGIVSSRNKDCGGEQYAGRRELHDAALQLLSPVDGVRAVSGDQTEAHIDAVFAFWDAWRAYAKLPDDERASIAIGEVMDTLARDTHFILAAAEKLRARG